LLQYKVIFKFPADFHVLPLLKEARADIWNIPLTRSTVLRESIFIVTLWKDLTLSRSLVRFVLSFIQVVDGRIVSWLLLELLHIGLLLCFVESFFLQHQLSLLIFTAFLLIISFLRIQLSLFLPHCRRLFLHRSFGVDQIVIELSKVDFLDYLSSSVNLGLGSLLQKEMCSTSGFLGVLF
jgi:hypothetical protein